jgi:hypothetical protein
LKPEFSGLTGRIRLSPNLIKNNFHWEIADGRWELGRKAGIAALFDRIDRMIRIAGKKHPANPVYPVGKISINRFH